MMEEMSQRQREDFGVSSASCQQEFISKMKAYLWADCDDPDDATNVEQNIDHDVATYLIIPSCDTIFNAQVELSVFL